MNNIFTHLSALTSRVSVSGAEESAAAYIRETMTSLSYKVECDALGNLICKKDEKEGLPTLLLCAHMDEIGFLVTDADENGFVFLAPIGGIKAASAAYTHVRFENGVQGCLVPPADAKDSDLDSKTFICDIGAKTREEALSRVQIGMRLATVSDLISLSETRVSARALDNKIGVCVLLKVAENLTKISPAYNVVFLFSVQEEVGLRGAKAAAFSISPDFAVNVDTTPAFDAYKDKGHVKLEGGVCVKYKDRSVICDRAITLRLEELAKEHAIPTQAEILTAGGTDTSVIQLTKSGVRVGALSVPVRYIHTDCETASLTDAKHAVDLLTLTLEKTL